jgi:hypothetical protein
LFSAAYGTFSKIDHIIGHKASLNNFKKIEITPLHHIRPQWNKTRCQQQKHPQKTLRQMKPEQHTAENPIGD